MRAILGKPPESRSQADVERLWRQLLAPLKISLLADCSPPEQARRDGCA